MQIEVSDRQTVEFDELAKRSPEATFYHSATWLDGLAAAYSSFTVEYLVAREQGAVVGYLPYVLVDRRVGRRAWSLPFGTYGGPVAGGRVDVAHALVQRFAALCGTPRMLEVGLVDLSSSVTDERFSFETSTTHVIPLPSDFDVLWKRFEKSKRRQTRKAEREGVSVTQCDSQSDLQAYYEIYLQRCRSWGQSLIYPQVLFDKLMADGGGRVRLFLARHDDRLIGGHLNFYFGDTVIAWNGVTSEHERASQASTLLYSTCLKHACESGFKRYNLGASLGKGSLEGYKSALGGDPLTYRTGRWRSLRGRFAAALKNAVKR